MAGPEQCRKSIHSQYTQLLGRASKGEINESCIYGIIEGRARVAGWHCGIPEAWAEFMPEELLNRQ